jgi:hypothetical protein
MASTTRQTYPCASGYGALDVITDPDDREILFRTSTDSELYLNRNQVRCLIHQLTDWLV